jgi:exoribonuclease R
MRPRVGEEFDAVVTGVAEFGAFVQLKGIQVDGLVHVTSLPATTSISTSATERSSASARACGYPSGTSCA